MNAIAEKTFAVADQHRFAALSGDRNPMHMDPIAARRTLAGAPVVHGIHTLLWALDASFAAEEPAQVASIKVSFGQMIPVDDHVVLRKRREADRVVLTAQVGSLPVLTATLGFGPHGPVGETLSEGPVREPAEPTALAFDDMAGSSGTILWTPSLAEDAARHFPAAATALGIARIAGLVRSSYLVGMVCPGLHSIYSGLTLRATAEGRDALSFAVTRTDPRFRRVAMAVAGAGWTGTIDAYARPEPSAQASLRRIAETVAPGEFVGASAFVIGGSRGLGELTAKIAAAGGAHVSVTFSVGEADARRVQAEIVANGGACDVLRYDVRADPAPQLAALPKPPNELYYFATPLIAKRRNAAFQPETLAEFLAFYVAGFHDLCRCLKARHPAELSSFYPSSVFVDDRPAGMTEYAMAKAAGEILCADWQNHADRPGPILVRRLPRLATDQTASLRETETEDALGVMLPIVRAVHAAGAG